GETGVRRDWLVACLWPESESSAARHRLSDTLYDLRRTIGDEAVAASGEILRANPSAIRADVIEFEEAVEAGDPAALPALPRPMLRRTQRPWDADYYDFSFSGLKTAVLNRVRELEAEGALDARRADVAAAFQEAAVDVLVSKTLRAVEAVGCRRVLLGGGVSANVRLREEMARRLGPGGVVLRASPRLSLDNGAMVARAGLFRLARGEVAPLDLTASAALPFPGLERPEPSEPFEASQRPEDPAAPDAT
ncbi:MAG: hypothetical protein RQ751_08965, partial [Longimicrobiales bacterium]|nr:hypothetical protein [Longimicrobiales bacterium]